LLILDRFLELRRVPQDVELRGRGEPLGDHRVPRYRLYIRADANAPPGRQFARAGGNDADQALEIEPREAELRHGGQVQTGDAIARLHGEQLDLAALRLRPHDGVRRAVELDALVDQVVHRLGRLLVAHMR